MMRITTNPVRAFAERACTQISKLEYDDVDDEQVILEEPFTCDVDGSLTPVTLTVLYDCGYVLCRLKPTADENLRRERELIAFEAIPQSEIDTSNDGELTGELYDTEIFGRVFEVLQSITGIREEAA